MSNDKVIYNRNLRWVGLVILHAQRTKGRAESGGWVREEVFRKMLDDQGYGLTLHELRDLMVYLSDPEIRCVETEKKGDAEPRLYRYRITARGVRAVEREEEIPGVGIYGHDE